MKKILITGAAGLIGSETSSRFLDKGWKVFGLDNNQRAVFFGPEADTRPVIAALKEKSSQFVHLDLDIRDREAILKFFEQFKPEAVVHAAGQPSHDLAASIPFDDFEINAVGTLNLLEATRRYVKDSPFVFLSTNKIYGDAPNEIKLIELDKRWDYDAPTYKNGIPETFRIDQSKHSLFGASKLAADILTQEYGRYFGMLTCCLRGGCLTGPNHRGVELHGFLQYLVKCSRSRKPYVIYGYKGKQVRDNIHACDVAGFITAFIDKPKAGGQVYNMGGGKQNTCSILEAFEMAESLTGQKMIYEYKDEARAGDHICYYSDLTKAMSDYPGWSVSRNLKDIFIEIDSHLS
jgi:CDP-paratose 2-epimerase